MATPTVVPTPGSVHANNSQALPLRPEHVEVAPLSAARMREFARNNRVAAHAKRTQSQNGEEGILEFLLKELGHLKPGWCVEFGAFDGQTDLNTWRLIEERKWNAVLIEGNPDAYAKLRARHDGNARVTSFNLLVDWKGRDGLDEILGRTPIPRDFEVLVIDIDGNDYYVWESLQSYRPKIVVIEFNFVIPAEVDFVQPPDGALHHQASLAAMCRLGKLKGYELVCVIGPNAIFVRGEYFSIFGIADNRPSAMYRYSHEMKFFQLYDGSVRIAGLNVLLWQSQRASDGTIKRVQFTDDDIQPLPQALRLYRPRHTYRAPLVEAAAGSLDESVVPGNRMLRHRFNVTSECGEDGILEALFSRLGISAGYCVDVGAGDGRTFSNTWRLLKQRGWSGLMIEREADCLRSLAKEYGDNRSATVIQETVTSMGGATIDSIMSAVDAPLVFDLLNVDVEGNDFHLWRTLSHHHPRVVVIDFNPSIPNDVFFAQREESSVHHGSSLRAMVSLARSKGYALVAVTDWNAIFVQSALAGDLILETVDLDRIYVPRFRTSVFQTMHGTLFIDGCQHLVRQNWRIDPRRLQVLPDDLMTVSVRFEDFGTQRTIFYE